MEIRGIWITTTDSKVFSSKERMTEAMNFLAQTGFNVVFPVVWKNGTTLYKSQVMKQRFGIEIDPKYVGRDPLAELIEAAKAVNLAVIPWFEYGFASSFQANGGYLLSKKPEWAGIDSVGNRLQKNNFFWMNALESEVQEFLLSLVLEVVKNYKVDGIQGDDRLPAFPSEGGYDPKTVQRYRQQFNTDPPQNSQEPQWLQWRADILTDFWKRLYWEAIALNPDLIISSSPSHYPWSLQQYLQDTQAWIDQGLVDLIHPQLYTRDLDRYKQLVDQLVRNQFKKEQLPTLAPGILLNTKGDGYRISPENLLQAIAYNRSNGINGEVFFFYEGLREDSDALAQVLRSGPYANRVPFNSKEVKQQGFTALRLGAPVRYIDKTGKVSLQVQFDRADSFCEQLARVKMGYKWAYMNPTGTLVTRFQFDEAECFAEGLARVGISGKSGYIDKSGKLVIPVQFDVANSFSEGLAAVQVGGKWGYIDKTGNLVIPVQFDGANSFSEGLAAVQVANKWGYIDKTGKLVIPMQLDGAESFSEGVAAVKGNSKWGYIDLVGKTVIPQQFDDAESFAEGLAAVKSAELWGYIDKTGKQVIPSLFESANSFKEGMAAVKVNNLWGYIRNVLR